MKKSIYLFGLVIVLGIAGLIEAISGYVLWFALPSGGGRRGLESVFLGLERHSWIELHDWAAIVLTAAVIVHLLLHWKWVVSMVKRLWRQASELRSSDKTAVVVREDLTVNK